MFCTDYFCQSCLEADYIHDISILELAWDYYIIKNVYTGDKLQ